MKNRSGAPWGQPGAIGGAAGTFWGAPRALPGRSSQDAPGSTPRACSDAFFAEFGRRPDISMISDRFFGENSIDFFERLLDDRRSLDDTFIVPARMRDFEKTSTGR